MTMLEKEDIVRNVSTNVYNCASSVGNLKGFIECRDSQKSEGRTV